MMDETIGLMHGETNGWVHNEWVDEWMETVFCLQSTLDLHHPKFHIKENFPTRSMGTHLHVT